MKIIKKLILAIISITYLIYVPDRIFAYDNMPLETQTYTNQIEEKNKLFKEALDKFGAYNKEEAVILYAEGVKQRSGPLQYSVMCRKLKIDFEEKMNEGENYAWVTGTSSPWISEYTVYNYKYIDNNAYSVIVKFALNDSKGIMGETLIELKVKKYDKIWCIYDIKEI